ncbi:MAG: PQQ-binding-like beta-propeller repeat protein [Bacteroidales bacterium]|nr:PQQ-binding-like beta-propeller repeat protein [Bacteroidales bacterium]
MKILTILFVLIYTSISGFSQQSLSWPGYRGPSDNGHSLAKNIPIHWNDSTNIEWRNAIPGQGWSSPVILDNQIWITTAIEKGQSLWAYCFDLESGKMLHNMELFSQDSTQESHPLNSFASPTPAIEKNRVYVHFGAYGTACIDTRSGKVLWERKDILCEHEVGPGSSPILYHNLLIFNMDGTDVQYIIALDKKTGKTIWKTYRGQDFSQKRIDEKKAFYTPIISKIDGIEQLISPGPHAVMGYHPLDGKQIWVAKYRGFSGSSGPIIYNNTLYVNTGFGFSSIIAIKLGGKGDLTETNILWENRKSMQARSSPLIVDDLYYMVNTGGQAKCINPATGEVLWTKRVGRHTSTSPVYAEGKIFTFDEEGLCTIFKPGKVFHKITENQLPDGCMASPALIDNAMIIRTKTHLYRVGGK